MRLMRLFLWLILAGNSLSCASFRAERLGSVPPFSEVPAPVVRRSISFAIAVHRSINGKEKDFEQDNAIKVATIWKPRTLDAYNESRYFSDVYSAVAGTELRATVSVTYAITSFWLNFPLDYLGSFIHCGTLMVFPVWETDVLTVRTSFEDHDGKELGTIEKKSEAIYTWQELFLIFAMPFLEPETVFDGVAYDLHRATLIEAAQRGWLQGTPDSAPIPAAP